MRTRADHEVVIVAEQCLTGDADLTVSGPSSVGRLPSRLTLDRRLRRLLVPRSPVAEVSAEVSKDLLWSRQFLQRVS